MGAPTQEGLSLRLYISAIGAVVENNTKHSEGSEWFNISPSGCVTSPKRNMMSSGGRKDNISP